jgi:hypothetical protein
MILSLSLLAVSAFTSPSGAAELRPAAKQLVANKVADYDTGYQDGLARGAALTKQYGCGSTAYNTAIRQAINNSRDPNNPDQLYWTGYVAGMQDSGC